MKIVKAFAVGFITFFRTIGLLSFGIAWMLLAKTSFASGQHLLDLPPDAGASYRVILGGIESTATELEAIVYDAATGAPLADAAVLVGAKVGDPFPENLAQTDSNGRVRFANAAIVPGQSISLVAWKEGFQALHLVTTTARFVQMFLQPQARPESHVFLRGRFENWPTGIGRSDLEAGLFLPAFRTGTMLNFDLNQVISSYRQEITVAGRTVRVPGNFVMPPQRKFYNIIPVTLEKQEFAMPLALHTQGYRTGILGNVPISQAVSRIQNKDFLGVMNLMKFTHTDWTGWGAVQGEETLQLPMTKRLRGNAVSSMHSKVPAGLDLVGFHLLDPTGDGRGLIPLDIKSRAKTAGMSFVDGSEAEDKSASGELKLADLQEDMAGAKRIIFSAVLDQAQLSAQPLRQLRYSAALSPVSGAANQRRSVTEFYMGLVNPGAVSADRQRFQFSFNGSNSLEPDYFAVNILAVVTDTNTGREERRLLWTSLLPGSARELTLPELASAGLTALPGLRTLTPGREERLYWQVLGVRRELANPSPVWDSLVTIENLRHITHATTAIEN